MKRNMKKAIAVIVTVVMILATTSLIAFACTDGYPGGGSGYGDWGYGSGGNGCPGGNGGPGGHHHDPEDESSEDVSSEDVSSEDVSSEDVSSEDVSSEDVSSEDVSSEDVSSEDVSSEDVSVDEGCTCGADDCTCDLEEGCTCGKDDGCTCIDEEEETTKVREPRPCNWCGEFHDEGTVNGFWTSFVHDIRYVCSSLFGFLNIFQVKVDVDVAGC